MPAQLAAACAALMRGAVQLPDYLERLQGGHRDIPIVLMPLLNDLRASRGLPAISEAALFNPDLQRGLPDPPGDPIEHDATQAPLAVLVDAAMVRASGRIPQISVVVGFAAGGAAINILAEAAGANAVVRSVPPPA